MIHHVVVCDLHLTSGERVLFQHKGSMRTVERAAHQAGWLTLGWPRLDLCPKCAQTDRGEAPTLLRSFRRLLVDALRRHRS